MERQRSFSLSNKVQQVRKWESIIAPLIKYNRYPHHNLTYPLDFYYSLQKIILKGIPLKLNIPLTLTGKRDHFLQSVFNSPIQEIGIVTCTSMPSKNKFDPALDKKFKQSLKLLKGYSDPCSDFFALTHHQNNNVKHFFVPYAVIKENGQISEKMSDHSCQMKSEEEFKNLSSIDSRQLVQSYIYTKGGKVAITRFFYFCDRKDSVAYLIENEEKKMNRSSWKVQEHIQFSCSHVKVMYKNKSFLTQTLNLIKALETYTSRKIIKIVTDWVVDLVSNKYFLIDLKEVQMKETFIRNRISRSIHQIMATTTCPMCQESYQQQQVTKFVTNKLIINFYKHIKQRGISLTFDSYISGLKKFDMSQICDLCYSLVVEEAKLKEISEKMHKICNVNARSKQKAKAMDTSLLQQTTQSMFQWRFFFFLQQIRDFHKIIQETSFQDITSFYLNIRIYHSVSSFHFTNSQHPTLKAIKIHSLFSDSSDISDFLEKEEIEVQISTKPGWNRQIAQGCLRGIYEREYMKQDFSQRKYKEILLFSENQSHCSLGMYIGMCCDGKKNIYGFPQKFNVEGIYNCESEYIGQANLPTQWMQIIDPLYCDAKADYFNQVKKSPQSITSSRKSIPFPLHQQKTRKKLIL